MLAAENKKNFNEVKIFNQLTETHRLINLAKKISSISKCKIQHVKNPRIENENNSLVAKPMGLIELGLKPIYLSKEFLVKEIDEVKKFLKRADKRKILATSKWKIN